MTAVPWDLLEREYAKLGVEVGSLPPRDQRAVGMMFLPRAKDDAAACRAEVEKTMADSGLSFHGWRSVPVDPSSLGPQSRENQPTIEQVRLTVSFCVYFGVRTNIVRAGTGPRGAALRFRFCCCCAASEASLIRRLAAGAIYGVFSAVRGQ